MSHGISGRVPPHSTEPLFELYRREKLLVLDNHAEVHGLLVYLDNVDNGKFIAMLDSQVSFLNLPILATDGFEQVELTDPAKRSEASAHGRSLFLRE